MSDYNGWTNYATWRVNLEIFDGLDISDYFGKKPDIYDLTDWARDYVQELLEMDGKEGLALDYARAFVSDVNYGEIAFNLLQTYEEEYEEEMA